MKPGPRVIVVGAGAAGILAAWRAASLGARVVLLEKTNRLGTKILVSGGGKCNIAHAGEIEGVLKAFRPDEARFLRPSCYRLRNDQIVDLFTSRGLRVYTRPDGRVFPVDQTAKDVVAILRSYLDEAGVEVRYESPVVGLQLGDRAVWGVRVGRASSHRRQGTDDGARYISASAKNLLRELDSITVVETQGETELAADRVVLCCGGSSYPASGTTGDGWPWAREAGHAVHKIRAALAPIYLQDSNGAELAGLSLRDVRLKARQGKEIAAWTGDLLFTHKGLSGPCALGISRTVAEKLEKGEVDIEIDFLPGRSFEEVAAGLLKSCQEQPGRRVVGYLHEMVPERIAPLVMSSSDVPLDAFGSRLDKKARNRLANTLKAWKLGSVRHVPTEKGEVVAGGVSLAEVDPHTMLSRKVENLYLCGEILDIAGPVGGYNLQAAFATGYIAGESAATHHL